MVGGSTPPWCVAVILFLVSLIPVLVAIARRFTRGKDANNGQTEKKENGMTEITNSATVMVSSIGCSALSTVLLSWEGQAART